MNRNQYFIDANILMYAIGREHPLKKPSIQLLRNCVENVYFTYTNVEVLQEILHRYTRLGERIRAIEASERLAKLVVQVLPITVENFSYALTLHKQYPQLTARDSIHAATLLQHNLTHMVSADRHFDNIPGFIRIDPADWGAHIAYLKGIK
ncbi:MAG: type II toxin-antitoxin system VapC family toxin [Chloroflexota bacterium]